MCLDTDSLELPKLRTDDGNDPLQLWGRFFRIQSEQDLEELAMTESDDETSQRCALAGFQ